MIIALLLAASTPAPAPEPAPAPATSAPAPTAPAAEERVVCRTMQRTGSRLGSRRVCRTVSEHRAADDNAAEATREMRNDSGGVADLSGPG